jgi:prevent-host-death family protein
MTARAQRAPSTWSVAEAKARLDDVIAEAEAHGPQPVARKADDQALVVPVEEWAPEPRVRGTLVEFLDRSPLKGLDIDFERHPDVRERDVDLW